MSFDLIQAIGNKIEELGDEGASHYFGKSKSTIAKWSNGSAIPDVFAGQKVLDEAIASSEVELGDKPLFDSPPVQGKTIPDKDTTIPEHKGEVGESEPGERPLPPTAEDLVERAIVAATKVKKFHILSPTIRDYPPTTLMSIMGTWKATIPKEVADLLAKLDIQSDTLLHHARNLLATRFLEGGDSEWSFWVDSDMIISFGNPSWMKAKTKTKHDAKWFTEPAITKLARHGKSLIGGVYSGRGSRDKLMFSGGVNPKTDDDRQLVELVKKGPVDEVRQVAWIPFGCTLVHRRVFVDILEKVPGVKSATPQDPARPHSFFDPHEGGPTSEDVSFCKRAAQAGHPAFLDLSIHGAHLGRYAFMP